MPCDNIQRRMVDTGLIEPPTPFRRDARRCFLVFEGRNRCFKITGVGKAVGTDRSPFGQGKALSVIFADISARAFIEANDAEHHAPRQQAYLKRLYLKNAEFSDEAEPPKLRHQ